MSLWPTHHNRSSHPCARGAFTLLELLVVVAIIALLISILLPGLSRAKQSAKTAVCVSNLHQIGNALQMYFLEHNEWFPFEKRGELPYLHAFYYGGHPGRAPWWGYTSPSFRDTPAGRPLNAYLYPDLPDYDVPADDPLFDAVRDVPVYHCPSDVGGFWQHSTGSASHNKRSLYYDSGSSYTMNYHFALNWALGTADKDEQPHWLHRANAFLRRQFQRHASELIMLFEDPFDSAQWNYFPRMGWHQRFNRHSFLFLDGHATNMLADTTKGNRGLGWKTCSGNSPEDPYAWWNNPDDPDYQYRNLPPLPG